MKEIRAQDKLPRSITYTTWMLDNSIPLPGGFRIGLDGLLGLIPGVGDVVSSSFSAMIIYKAHQLGAPISVLLRMLVNVIVDTLVGAIPFAGDVFDFVFKANVRNVKLLQEHLDNPDGVKRRSRLFTFILVFCLVSVIALAVWIAAVVIEAIWHGLSG